MQPAPAVPLTPEQEQIVRHDHGPALVFAVAGAGKTTAMVHRIERLVREGLFAPEAILATSFSRASVADIRSALAPWPHCARVHVTTLHAVGLGIIKQAEARRLLPASAEHGALEEKILAQALAQARRLDASYKLELETLDTEDFLTYVGACKGNLRYADLAAAGLPASAHGVAEQAEGLPGQPWYLDLYRLFERVRQGMNVLTFDDMLMTGWELLVRHPALLERVRSRFACVLVDEFQDVNHAQSEMLDLLSAPHRNYMVIGDDDQTIYEWRGASPRFILSFAERYGARKYHIRDNFRSAAPHLALANNVIRHNRHREPKRLSLTQGFGGRVHVHKEQDAEETGRHVAEHIQGALQDGFTPDQIAVLVRLYAQTPPIEQALIERQIAYRVVGNEPFYGRPELAVLLRYLSLAMFEQQLALGERLAPAEAAQFKRWWYTLYNKPNRYIARPLADQIAAFVVQGGMPPSEALRRVSGSAPWGTAGRMESLAETLTWLASVYGNRPADAVLGALEQRLGYADFLRAASPVTGEGKAAGVAALIRYARGKGTALDLLGHLRTLARDRQREEADPAQAVVLSSIHRAKGLEWPVVFVPDCNQGVLPFDDKEGLEEERRLFYVAVTRARQHLHLHVARTLPLSQFLKEAAYRRTLTTIDTIAEALERDPATWETEHALTLARFTHRLALDRYLAHWWSTAAERRQAVARRVLALFRTATRHGLSAELGLTPHAEAFWQRLAPEADAAEALLTPDAFADLPAFAQPPPEKGLQEGHRVEHPTFGAGEVVSLAGPEGDERVLVRFVDAGERKLAARLARLRRIES